MVRRERVEKLAFARLLADLASAVNPTAKLDFEPIIGAYLQSVFQVPQTTRRPQPKPQDIAHKALLSKVDQMTVPDDQMPTPPKKRGGRRR